MTLLRLSLQTSIGRAPLCHRPTRRYFTVRTQPLLNVIPHQSSKCDSQPASPVLYHFYLRDLDSAEFMDYSLDEHVLAATRKQSTANHSAGYVQPEAPSPVPVQPSPSEWRVAHHLRCPGGHVGYEIPLAKICAVTVSNIEENGQGTGDVGVKGKREHWGSISTGAQLYLG